MSDAQRRYSDYRPLQAVGEQLAAKAEEAPTRRPRWAAAGIGLLAAGAVAVTPVGAAIADAIDDLVGSEPTSPSLFFGDLPGDRQPSKVQELYFEDLLKRSAVVGTGTTPAGTAFQMVMVDERSSPVFGSCAFVAFDTDSDASRDVQTCVGPTVSEGFQEASVPIYPTIFRGPVEQGEIPTPTIIGLAPPEVASVRITYPGADGDRVEAETTTVPVSRELLAANDDRTDLRDALPKDRQPSSANDPYSFFVGFLPPSLDRNGPNARQVDLDFDEIGIAALDDEGAELFSLRMDGRFSGDPGLLSVG